MSLVWYMRGGKAFEYNVDRWSTASEAINNLLTLKIGPLYIYVIFSFTDKT